MYKWQIQCSFRESSYSPGKSLHIVHPQETDNSNDTQWNPFTLHKSSIKQANKKYKQQPAISLIRWALDEQEAWEERVYHLVEPNLVMKSEEKRSVELQEEKATMFISKRESKRDADS